MSRTCSENRRGIATRSAVSKSAASNITSRSSKLILPISEPRSASRCCINAQPNAANKNAGVTDLPRSMRASVLPNAASKNVLLRRITAGRMAGNSASIKPRRCISAQLAKAWPDKNSFKTSSKSRAGGISANNGLSSAISLSVSRAIVKPSLAFRRAARSMRTGSSR